MRKDASVGVDLYGRDVSASKAFKTLGDVASNTGKRIDHVANNIIKGMAAAGAAAAAVAVKLGVDSVKAAAEDATAARKLAVTLDNVTHASRRQKKAVEDYIYATEMRLGIEDNALRPALARLVRSTEDVTKAQKILNLALDISAGTGKSLDVVVAALGKAYDGNMASLGRLGLGLDKATLKSGKFNEIFKILQNSFHGFAAKDAATFEGKLRRIQIAFDEAKESVGYLLMDALTPYLNKLTELIPKVQEWVDANGPKLQKAFSDAAPKIQDVLDKLLGIGKWVKDHKETLMSVGKALLAGLAAEKVAAAVLAIIKTLDTLRTAYLALAAGEALATGGANIWAGLAAIAAAGLTYVAADAAMGGPATAGGRAGTDSGQTLAGTLTSPKGQFNYGAWATPAPAVTINVHGSVTTERDLVTSVRNAITQANRRQGADLTVTGRKTK